jgi:DNA-binding ferritin-like protein
MNFSSFFLFLNILKTLHWLTKSYAHHKVLDDAYTDFSDKIDEFIESCIGINNPKSFHSIAVNFEMPDTEEDIVLIFERAFDDLSTALAKYANRTELESIVDDFNNLANKYIYLLKMN